MRGQGLCVVLLAAALGMPGAGLAQTTVPGAAPSPAPTPAPIPRPAAGAEPVRPVAVPRAAGEGVPAAPEAPAAPVPATEAPTPVPAVPVPAAPPSAADQAALRQAILTVDQEALYADSAWGKRVQAILNQRSASIAADNERYFGELSAAEAALTDARAGLTAEEFRARASAFDSRATAVRQERELAARELSMLAQAERDAFFSAAAPVLGEVMRERGALVVLDPRTVLFSASSIDVTELAVSRIDARVGDGAGTVSAEAIAATARAAIAAEATGTAPAEGAAGGPASDLSNVPPAAVQPGADAAPGKAP